RRRDVSALANRRATGNEANAIGNGETTGRKCVLVDKGEHVTVRQFLQLAQAETKQNPLLYPGIDRPASVDFVGGADIAARQGGAEVEKNATGFVGVGDGLGVEQGFDGGLQSWQGIGHKKFGLISSNRQRAGLAT